MVECSHFKLSWNGDCKNLYVNAANELACKEFKTTIKELYPNCEHIDE